MRTIQAGQYLIGEGQPCFIAAEAGINHNGDIRLAHELIDAAVAAGADAIKFQNYQTEDFVSSQSLTYEYQSQGQRVVETQFEMFKRCELSLSSLKELREHCDEKRIVFFSTPTSERGIDELVRVGAPFLKNGSDYLVHLPLIRAMARTQLPAVLSTGMATLAEIDEAVRAFREAGGDKLILLHCTSSYPTPPEDVHLRKIPTLAAAFDCLCGFSDHTQGVVAAVGAVALGACFIEKHFTIDKNLAGPDHWFSSDPAGLRELVNAVRAVEKNLGSTAVGPTPSEIQGRDAFRLSCVAAKNLPKGHKLTETDVAFQRSAGGLLPRDIHLIIGRHLRSSLMLGEPIRGEALG